MLDLQLLRDAPDRVRAGVAAKGYPADAVDRALALDADRRRLVTERQAAQTRLNEVSKTIGGLMQAGRRDEAEAARAETSSLKARIKTLDDEVAAAEGALQQVMLELPNVPHAGVPVGRSAEDNVVDYEEGTPPTFDFAPLPHWELAARHGLVDFERGAKVAGAGFPFYVGQGARLQRALIQLFLDVATTQGGYTEVQPPLLINEASGIGTGQLPDKEAQMYAVPLDGLYLVPTAEVPVTNFYRDEILEEEALPLRLCAYTPCFRREAGSYGKDVRGLNRLHQFDKVELVQFVHPARSYEALEALRADAERALRLLALPWRRLVLCTGDLGRTQAKTYDLEVWSAAQARWLEVSSVSNFESYQARRAGVRYRPSGGGKPEHVHTLNGSALALPRLVAALLENGQQADGSIVLPKALHPYTGFSRIG